MGIDVKPYRIRHKAITKTGISCAVILLGACGGGSGNGRDTGRCSEDCSRNNPFASIDIRISQETRAACIALAAASSCSVSFNDESLDSYHTLFLDNDSDGYGNPSISRNSLPTAGWVIAGGDCNDADPGVHPGAREIVDGIDNDCDGVVEDDEPTATENLKITASDANVGDYFGLSVSLSGDKYIAGAVGNDDDGIASGSAYIFAFDGTAWSETAKLTASDAVSRDMFGHSVSLSGDKAIVGAVGDDNAGLNSGSAYLFDYDGTGWNETANLTASDAAEHDEFGQSVSLSGDTAIIGANGNDDAGEASGSAYIFSFDGSSWSETVKIVASDAAAGDEFGQSVAMSGHRAIVGASGDDDAGLGSGSAYIFSFDGVGWSQTVKLMASDGARGDSFGHAVAISGDKAIVGAFGDRDGGTLSGSAYLFAFDGIRWQETAKLTASDARAGDQFGHSVSISGDKVIVGAIGADDSGDASGSGYRYEFDGISWIETVKIVASDAAAGDEFGQSVSVSGDVAIVSSPYDRNNTGAAYLFE